MEYLSNDSYSTITATIIDDSPTSSSTTTTTTGAQNTADKNKNMNEEENSSKGFQHVRLASQPPTPPKSTLRTVSSTTTGAQNTADKNKSIMTEEDSSKGFQHVRLASQPPTPPTPPKPTLRTVASSPTFSRARGCLRDSVSLCLPHFDPVWRNQTPPMTKRPYDMAARIILLGDFHVGKTSILRSLSRAKDETGTCCCCEFRPGELVTAIFKRDRKQSLVKVMDTGGQEKYRSMTSSYYRGVHGCLLVFDVTREDTFLNIVSWHQDLDKYTGDQFVASILVGTTSHPGQRVVSAERAFKLAENLNMTYLETEADDDQMTIAIVQRLLDTIIRNGFMKSSNSVIIVPHDTQPLRKNAAKCSC